MKLSHLRKQAKNLHSIFPELVAAHGSAMTLSHAQDAIARTHGFPSWAIAVAKANDTPGPLSSAPRSEPSIAERLKAGYHFQLEAEGELVIALDDNAEPTKKAMGREFALSLRDRGDAVNVRREDRALDALVEELGCWSGDFDDYSAEALERLRDASHRAVSRCPLYVDGWNHLAGSLFTQNRLDDAMAIAEPVANALLDLLPREGIVQVCYGVIANRPFFRITHCYLLLLHARSRHRDANALAKRLYSLWPNDNMGFRFLLTRASRDAH